MDDNSQLYFLIVLTPLYLATVVGMWKLFEKAGEAGWKSLIPIYAQLIHLKILGRPSYWIIYLLIPGIGIIVAYGLLVDLLKTFGKYKFHQHAAGLAIPFIYLPYMAFKKDVEYIGTLDELPERKRSTTREWADAIVFAVFAATIIRWLFMEAFTIPTPSMEKSLLVGDFLFVSKFHYGTRTPKTPIQMPLTHQKIWGTNIPSYAEWIQLPQYRLPGLTEVKRGDVVVFNVPGVEQNNIRENGTVKPKSEWIEYPTDLKTNYIKRCVGIPGDVIKIVNKQLYVNDEPFDNPEEMQYPYAVVAKTQISDRVLDRLDVDRPYGVAHTNNSVYHEFYLTDREKAALEGESFILSVTPKDRYKEGIPENNIFPSNPELFPWNGDWYGPLTIPKKGMTIDITRENLITYGETIKLYDFNDDVKIEGNKLIIDGQEVSQYTFKQDYYFMMGDNRHNSLDSRYWGFVPADHIVGKGFFIWLSLDQNESFLSKIRWERFFNLIR